MLNAAPGTPIPFGNRPLGGGALARWGVKQQRDRGASAVEFALVVPVILALAFGILDYGLWFNDSLNLRQGIREGARAGSLSQFGSDTSCGLAPGGSSDMRRLACLTKDEIGSIGTAYVKVVPDPDGYDLGDTLTVCGQVEAKGVTGLTPLPNDGRASSMIKMVVEVKSTVSQSAAQSAGAGLDWSWCR
jgi:hypothetical protein